MAELVTANQVAATVGGLNRRSRKAIPFKLQDVAPVFIFNIYAMKHERGMGSLGTFHISACEEGAEYASFRVKGAFFDEYDEGEGKLGWNYDTGSDVAAAIIGEGCEDPLSNLPMQWGCFWSANEKPTRQELAKARERLTAKMRQLLAQADRLALQGDSGIAKIEAVHRNAATFLKQHRTWESGDTGTQMSECPGCGGFVKPGIAKCGGCGAILDFAKAYALGLTSHPTAPTGTPAQQKLVS